MVLTVAPPKPIVIKFVPMDGPAPECELLGRVKGKAATIDEAIFAAAWQAYDKGGDTVQVKRVSGREGKRVVKGKAYKCE